MLTLFFLLFWMGWMWLDLFCTAYQLPYNGVAAAFVLVNYAVVGVISIFWRGAHSMTQVSPDNVDDGTKPTLLTTCGGDILSGVGTVSWRRTTKCWTFLRAGVVWHCRTNDGGIHARAGKRSACHSFGLINKSKNASRSSF